MINRSPNYPHTFESEDFVTVDNSKVELLNFHLHRDAIALIQGDNL